MNAAGLFPSKNISVFVVSSKRIEAKGTLDQVECFKFITALLSHD